MTTSTETPLPVEPVSLAEGDEMPASTVGPITRTDIVRYAGAGGDMNPIHHDEEFARHAGMPGVFAMGMMHAGMLGVRLARWVGPTNLRSFTVRFTGQVWPEDVLTFSGRVERVEDGIAHLGLAVTRQDGSSALKASATAVVAAG
jgi:acyl dehydratase